MKSNAHDIKESSSSHHEPTQKPVGGNVRFPNIMIMVLTIKSEQSSFIVLNFPPLIGNLLVLFDLLVLNAVSAIFKLIIFI